MIRKLTTALIAFAAGLGATASAQADTFIVVGTDDVTAAPSCTQIQPGLHQCPMLRSAVNASSGGGGPHAISLPTGTIQLTAGQLILDTNLTIAGNGARATTVDAGETSRVFMIAGGASVSMANFTVANGNVNNDDGGNFLVSGNTQLTLTAMRVTGGVARAGAGINSLGTVSIQASLIDNNNAQIVGGAIYNVGTSETRARVDIVNSTLAANYSPTGAVVASEGNPTNQVHLYHATAARNQGEAFWLRHSQGTSANASIIGPNANTPTVASDNCDLISQGAPFSNGSWNVANDSTCGLTGTTNRQNTDPLVAGALTNQGGATDVLTVPANSPAVDLVTPCSVPADQRLFTRFQTTGQPCDAGAYEQSGTTNPTPTPTPQATATAQPTVQTPVPTASPTPVVNKTAVADLVRGTVRYRPRGSRVFVELVDGTSIPFGSTVDARRGTIKLTTIPRAGAAPESAEFRDGIFLLTQSRGITDLKLTEALNCAKRARAAQKKPKSRKLWGKGSGKFRTTGSYSAATIRGTEWLVQDTCTTTLTRVKVGVVSVRDTVKKRTIVLRAPRSYTARARRR